jgi:hypothetical protein
MRNESEPQFWTSMWMVGLWLWGAGVPALIGFLAGTRLDGVHGGFTFRFLFGAVGLLVGALATSRLLRRRRPL